MATANDLSPRRVLVRGTANVNVSDDRSRRLVSEMSWQSPDKYPSIRPCSVLCTYKNYFWRYNLHPIP